ncbi:MAG: hypothetical protein ACXAE3_07240 [Candidatus Kariarchaeaceae archaeon]
MSLRLLFLLSILLAISGTPVQAQLQNGNFSSELDIDSAYRWNIKNYQIGDRRVEFKSSPTAFEFVHGSRVELVVLQDPSGVDITSFDTLSSATDLSDYFDLRYDGLSYDFFQADLLYLWIFPLRAVAEDGSSVNLISEFWIFNLHNLLLNGETLKLNATVDSDFVTSDETDDEIIVNYDDGSATIQAKVDKPTGLLNSINFVSSSPDFRIEIDRRGGGSALPISPLPVIFALIATTWIVRRVRSSLKH